MFASMNRPYVYFEKKKKLSSRSDAFFINTQKLSTSYF